MVGLGKIGGGRKGWVARKGGSGKMKMGFFFFFPLLFFYFWVAGRLGGWGVQLLFLFMFFFNLEDSGFLKEKN